MAFEHDLVARLFHAARYRFGRCIELLLAAIERALGCGSDALTNQHFAEAWFMDEGREAGRNLFLAADWAEIDPDAGLHEDAALLRMLPGDRGDHGLIKQVRATTSSTISMSWKAGTCSANRSSGAANTRFARWRFVSGSMV